MSIQAHPPPRPIFASEKPMPKAGLRPPEERAFDVATINRRLALMAERAAPRAPGRGRVS